MKVARLLRPISGAMLVLHLLAGSAEALDLCPSQPVVHANATVTMDGVLYSDRAKLKIRFLDYKKHNPNCIMSFVADRETGPKVYVGLMALLAQTGLLGDGKAGFLIEPRNTP